MFSYSRATCNDKLITRLLATARIVAPEPHTVGHQGETGNLVEIIASIKSAARNQPQLKEALLQAWLAEDYESEVRAFLADGKGGISGSGGGSSEEDVALVSDLYDSLEDEFAVGVSGPSVYTEPKCTFGGYACIGGPGSPIAPLGLMPHSVFGTEGGLESNGSTASAQAHARRCTVVIAYFPRTADEALVAGAIAPFAAVRRMRIARDESGASRCYAFVEFFDEAGAEASLAACQQGRISLDDEFGHRWHLRASRARRAVAASASTMPKRRRGTRGGHRQHQHPKPGSTAKRSGDLELNGGLCSVA